MRVPTWCPFRLQFYFNGHNALAAKLTQAGINYTMLDNAFVAIDDFDKAQALADEFSVHGLQETLDHWANKLCPGASCFVVPYQWSISQAEYATDIVFRRQSELAPLYDQLVRSSVHAIKAEHVATFLGRKLTKNYQDEIGNDFSPRINGTRIKHSMGPASLKMYDKYGIILRLETTINNVSFLKHHRMVNHRDGTRSFKLAPLRKTIFNLPVVLRDRLLACNHRYLHFLSELDDSTVARKDLTRTSRNHRGDWTLQQLRDPHHNT